jgi:fluoride exporter
MEPAVLIGIGGGTGSVARYLCSKLQPYRGLPTGTLLVNVLGSFLLGLIVFSRAPPDVFYFAGAGIMGGFTTFSTFSYETFRMLEDRDYYTMLLNILTNGGGSILVVMIALWICMALGIHG